MHSSTSSSEQTQTDMLARPLPSVPMGKAALVAFLTALLLLIGWEAYWRVNGAPPSYRDSPGQWAAERRRINNGEGDKTVLIGSSRTQWNMQLDIWEELSGERPIQLSLAGTTVLPVLEGIADDPDFTGTLIVGIAPSLFGTGFQYYGANIERYEKESPSQWLSHQISQIFEPHLAFYNFEFALFSILERQAWTTRKGVYRELGFRRLGTLGKDRNTKMWHRVEENPEYADFFKSYWMQYYDMSSDEPNPAIMGFIDSVREEKISRAVEAVSKLEQRGVDVVFIRHPTSDELQIATEMYFSRKDNWDVLIERSGSPGLHFEDYEEMQGYELPEWSHMTGSEADRYTRAMYPLIQRELEKQ